MRLLASRGAVTNAPMPPPDKLVDALFTHVITNDAPGAAVWSPKMDCSFKKGYGRADVAHSAGFAPDTKSRIGSITKQFTASAILKLQEQASSTCRQALEVLPDFPRSDEVTLHHLSPYLGHPQLHDKPGFIEKVTSPVEADDLIKSFQNDAYDFARKEMAL